MDRRRFVPSPDGLEGRQLLSLFGGKSSATNRTTVVQSLPDNFQQKLTRIEHLPFFMEQLQPGRFLPPDAVKGIQADLTELAANLHAPSSASADAFNTTLRHLFVRENLSKGNANLLDARFTSVLVSAGANPTAVQHFQSNMKQLAVADANSIEGSRLAANDYALVLQTALAVGRPIVTPGAPTLAAGSGQRETNGTSGSTYNHNPTLVGNYASGASTDPATTTMIQLIDAGGHVLGVAPVESNGKYTVKVVAPLADGVYRIRSQAVDWAGHVSRPSAAFALRVATKPSQTTTATQTLVSPGLTS